MEVKNEAIKNNLKHNCICNCDEKPNRGNFIYLFILILFFYLFHSLKSIVIVQSYNDYNVLAHNKT